MKIALLAAANSIHTVQWANGLASLGHEIHVISQHPVIDKFDECINLHLTTYRGNFGYYFMLPYIKRVLKEIKPDILNVHYASGYGTSARLVNFHPYVLSVWGSDIFIFPFKSSLHRWIIRRNILSADAIASTSNSMAKQIYSIVPELKSISITPFGVDLNKFNLKEDELNIEKNKIVIGTIKTMSLTYGIDILIKSFDQLIKRIKSNPEYKNIELKLKLIGGGVHLNEFINLVKSLQIQQYVEFVGQINHTNVPFELAKLDIFVALSRSESFGVAVIEAGAAGKPVVVSNVGGLPEVVIPNITGLIIENENILQSTNELEKLVINPILRKELGINARNFVAKNYSLNVCLNKMISLYEITIAANK
jgi:glycosyltransferase involved in cell wall biosynthesis